jgi:plastocyanin
MIYPSSGGIMARRLWLASALFAIACSSNSTGPGSGCTTSATLACVGISDFHFSPATLTIKVGTQVQWTNSGPTAHTTTSNTGAWDSGVISPPSGGGGYGGGGSTPGGSYTLTFASAGTYSYHCTLHPPSMSQYASFTGTITVTP